MKSLFKRDTREVTINKEIDAIVNKIIDDHSDEELSYMIVEIKNRSIRHLKHRKELLGSEIDNLNELINQADEAIKFMQG